MTYIFSHVTYILSRDFQYLGCGWLIRVISIKRVTLNLISVLWHEIGPKRSFALQITSENYYAIYLIKAICNHIIHFKFKIRLGIMKFVISTIKFKIFRDYYNHWCKVHNFRYPSSVINCYYILEIHNINLIIHEGYWKVYHLRS